MVASALSVGCDDEPRAAQPPGSNVTVASDSVSTSSRRDQQTLGSDEFVAACLSEEPTPRHVGHIDVDLCIADFDGNRSVVRSGIDPAVGPAVSPDGRIVAFLADGTIRTIRVDGDAERSLGVRASSVAWHGTDGIAFVDVDQRSIRRVGMADPKVEAELLDIADQRGLGEGWLITSFAVSPSSRELALVAEDREPQRFALFLIDTTDGSTIYLRRPQDEGLTSPAFDPSGRSLAYVEGVGLRVVEVDSRHDRQVGPNGWYASTPVWLDRHTLLWIANAVAGPYGPAAVVIGRADSADSPRVVYGNHDQEFVRFPAFPSRPATLGD